MIDEDILKRKLGLKGYCFPCEEKNKLTCYKLTTIAKQDYTIEGPNVLAYPTRINITRFTPDPENEGIFDEVNSTLSIL